MPRVRLANDERRAQLLELGVQLFGCHAFDELTTDLIAAKGSISKGLLFHYFGSKRGFYLATIEHVSELLLARVVLDTTGSAPEAVTDAVTRFLDFVRDHASIYRALLRGGLGFDPQSQAIVERVRWTIVNRVLGLLNFRPMELDSSTPVVTAAGLRLYGWVGGIESLSLAWIDHGVSRTHIRTLMVDSFAPVIRAWPQDRATAWD